MLPMYICYGWIGFQNGFPEHHLLENAQISPDNVRPAYALDSTIALLESSLPTFSRLRHLARSLEGVPLEACFGKLVPSPASRPQVLLVVLRNPEEELELYGSEPTVFEISVSRNVSAFQREDQRAVLPAGKE